MMVIVQHFVIYCKNFVSKNGSYVTKILVLNVDCLFNFAERGDNNQGVLATIYRYDLVCEVTYSLNQVCIDIKIEWLYSYNYEV